MQLLCCTFKRVQLFTVVVAATTIVSILMILFSYNYPTLARKRVIDAVVFKNGSFSMDRFRTTADLENLRLSFYVYNVTNVDQVLNSSAKPNLEEIGPFVYSEFKSKEFIDNNQTSGLITYRLRRKYTFDRNFSIADPTKVLITWPNVPLFAAKAFLDKLPIIERLAAYWVMNRAIKTQHEPPFITDTVENFIFDGSERKFFEYLQTLDKFKLLNPWPLKDNKFAFLYGKNNTIDPSMNLPMTNSAGFGLNQTYRDLNQYVLVNGSRSLNVWPNEPKSCNAIGGTDGEFFSPFIEHDQDLQIFSIDLCRQLNLKFREKVTLNGIPVSKYTLDDRSLQSAKKNPANQCYCLARDVLGGLKKECDWDGLIDLANCNTPSIVASGAHFAAGSPDLVQKVSGLTMPNSSIHEPTLFVEPNTGVTVQVRVPFQFNVRMERGGFGIFDFLKDGDTLILPLLWVSENAELTDDQAWLLKTQLVLLDSWLVIMVLGGAIIFISMILFVASVVCLRFRRRTERLDEPSETDPLLNPATRVETGIARTRATDST